MTLPIRSIPQSKFANVVSKMQGLSAETSILVTEINKRFENISQRLLQLERKVKELEGKI